MVKIITDDVKRYLNYNTVKKVDFDELKVSQQISKNIKGSGKKHLPVKKNILDKFSICKYSKTNALMSNTNQIKRIKVAFKIKEQ